MASYRVLRHDHRIFKGRAVYRIQRVDDDTLGGYLETEANLSQSGTCFIHGDSIVAENATITDDAQVFGLVYGNAKIQGRALIYGTVSGNAVVRDNAKVYGIVGDDAVVDGDSVVYGVW